MTGVTHGSNRETSTQFSQPDHQKQAGRSGGKQIRQSCRDSQIQQDLGKAPAINTQVLRLQASLNAAQKSYSLEQARLSWLENPVGKPEDMQFDNEKLFPDFPFGEDIETYKQETTQRIGDLARTLKGLQVEMENIFALNFEAAPEISIDADTLASVKGITSLDPGRVAKLTR